LAVPQLKELTFTPDERGIPHLEAVYSHWRPHGGKQREDQFSDGTLRLLGLLWSLLDGDSLLLLEEPELSLHPGIVRMLPALLHRLARPRKRQLILTTHSPDLLSDKSIAAEETILLKPSSEGTEAKPASEIAEVKALLEAGFNMAEAVLPRTKPANMEQLDLFE
jgi:predicted ATPase